MTKVTIPCVRLPHASMCPANACVKHRCVGRSSSVGFLRLPDSCHFLNCSAIVLGEHVPQISEHWNEYPLVNCVYKESPSIHTTGLHGKHMGQISENSNNNQLYIANLAFQGKKPFMSAREQFLYSSGIGEALALTGTRTERWTDRRSWENYGLQLNWLMAKKR